MDKNGNLPLGFALFSGQEALAKTLLKHKANVNALDASGKSLLVKSIEQSNKNDFYCFFQLLMIFTFVFSTFNDLYYYFFLLPLPKREAFFTFFWFFLGNVNVAQFLLTNAQLDVNAGTDNRKRSALLVLAAYDSKTYSELIPIADLILQKNPNFSHVDESNK